MDTKSPGTGLVYTVGTIEVADTTGATPFSGAAASAPAPLVGFNLTTLTPPESRQVGMLQVATPGQVPAIQRYLYGTSPGVLVNPDDTRATNIRGVSVWPEAEPGDTRIVVCGESFDELLPMSQVGNIGALASGNNWNGFLMVFDGIGTLLWSYHFYGATGLNSSAITDVSVRVVLDENGEPTEDVITFCGISSHGNPATGNGALTPVDPFTAPSGGLPCSLPASGAVDNGPGQWDGIVGRLARPHDPAVGPAVVDFLSIVGGAQQDGLFGIDEISVGSNELEPDRFVTVGSTATGGLAGTGSFTFPLTNGACLAPAQYCLGVVMTLNKPSGALVLEQSDSLGQLDQGTHTILRDVFVHRDYNLTAGTTVYPHMYAMVGSTDDDLALSGLGVVAAPDPVLSGATDGLLVCCIDQAPGFLFLSGTFRGGEGDDGLTGVRGWNEFRDHLAVVGFTDLPSDAMNIDVASYFYPSTSVLLEVLTGGQIYAAGYDRPTCVGPLNATVTVPWSQFLLGDPAGGGITVDPQSTVNVVGTTHNPNYPVVGGLAYQAPRFEAVHSTLDLLPVNATGFGVGRTDGTGQTAPAPFGPLPIPGFTGGTSPFCALAAFGDRIDRDPPSLPRMNIDFRGDPSAGATNTAILVSRPTPGANLNFAALQFGFPNTTAPYLSLPDGLEVWTTAPSTVTFFVGMSLDYPIVFNLTSPLPGGSVTLTAQLVCFQPTATIPGGNPNSATPCVPIVTTTGSASPALWIDY
ncbi:MAG: hypothetical protein KDC98_05075 [Planctomycetes bacterium]|nr:hypothetical protein [Planctomycetota bacterium]